QRGPGRQKSAADYPGAPTGPGMVCARASRRRVSSANRGDRTQRSRRSLSRPSGPLGRLGGGKYVYLENVVLDSQPPAGGVLLAGPAAWRGWSGGYVVEIGVGGGAAGDAHVGPRDPRPESRRL